MNIKELSDILFEFIKFTNTFWGVYATVTIALLGWVFSSEKPWSHIQKLSISVSYASVISINCLAQVRFNRLIDATLFDLNKLLTHVDNIPNLKAQLLSIPKISENIIVSVYILIAVAVIYI